MQDPVVEVQDRGVVTTYFSTRKAAEVLKVSPSTIRRWIGRIRSKERGRPKILNLLRITWFTDGDGNNRRWYLERESVMAFKQARKEI